MSAPSVLLVGDPHEGTGAMARAAEGLAGQAEVVCGVAREGAVLARELGASAIFLCPEPSVSNRSYLRLFDELRPTPIVVVDRASVEELELRYPGAVDWIDTADATPERFRHSLGLAVRELERGKRARFLAEHDGLTGLLTRPAFLGAAKEALERQAQALLLIDLDHLRNVNDTLGIDAGDLVIQRCALRLREIAPPEAILGRLCGEELALLVPARAELFELAERIRIELGHPTDVGGSRVHVTSSIGAARSTDHSGSIDRLCTAATLALETAKDGGGNLVHVAKSDQAPRARWLELDTSLRQALRANEFFLCYQPQLDLRTEEVSGVEALLRWRRQNGTIVSPAEFIPALEETGFIVEVGAWVVEEACRQASIWRRAAMPVRMAVNVSPIQFRRGDLLAVVKDALARAELPASGLELEITEGLLVEHARVEPVLKELRALGARISVDDFGTGYSSLGYLRKLPIDQVKIDQSFVKDLVTDAGSRGIARAIIDLAHGIGLEVLAEGIETQAQLDTLRAEGCDQGQGYLFARPLPAQEAGAWLALKPIVGRAPVE